MLFQLGWPLDYCFTHPPPSETGFILLAQAPALLAGCETQNFLAWMCRMNRIEKERASTAPAQTITYSKDLPASFLPWDGMQPLPRCCCPLHEAGGAGQILYSPNNALQTAVWLPPIGEGRFQSGEIPFIWWLGGVKVNQQSTIFVVT
jgi:hypothetical protein